MSGAESQLAAGALASDLPGFWEVLCAASPEELPDEVRPKLEAALAGLPEGDVLDLIEQRIHAPISPLPGVLKVLTANELPMNEPPKKRLGGEPSGNNDHHARTVTSCESHRPQ